MMFKPGDVNIARVLQEIEILSRVGRTDDNGVSRYTLSEAHQQAVNLVGGWMDAAELFVHHDRWGNLYGRTPTAPGAKSIMAGSHLDSVPHGGHYDGPLGVLSALEAARMILEQGIVLKKPIEIVSFIEEEGASFIGLMGSLLATGKITEDDVRPLENQLGQAYVDLLDKAVFAYPVDQDKTLKGRVDVYVELHIEQGRRLETAGVPVGVVTGIAGPNFVQFSLIGRSDHAGATAYADRQDTVLAAAEIVQGVRSLGVNRFEDRGHMTVGRIDVAPNVMNVVAGQTDFTVDFRAVDDITAAEMREALLQLVDDVTDRHHLKYSIASSQHVPAAPVPDYLQDIIADSSREATVASMPLVSWAAHDAMVMSNICDSGMIFVPSANGRSHTPEEFTRPEDIAAGIAVLANTLVRLAT